MITENDPSQIYNTVTLLLSEKRTSLSVLRTAIAIFTIPSSVLTILIATSKYYDITKNLYFAIPLLLICLALTILGVYLVIRSFKRLKEIDHKIHEIKNKDEYMNDILEE